MPRLCGYLVYNLCTTSGNMPVVVRSFFQTNLAWVQIAKFAAFVSVACTSLNHYSFSNSTSVNPGLYTLSTWLTINTTNIFKG